MNAETVIKYSTKFMKLLCSYIEDKGSIYNTETRVVYRGIDWAVLK